MDIKLIIALAVIAALLIAAAVLSFKQYKLKKNVDNLADSINDFINTKKKTEFSVYDNHFSKLQNGIADLQDIISLEQNRLINENKKNTQFISDISHQLKTPLAALRLYCEMDNNANPTPHNEKELQLIDKMEKLVYQLLRLEKIKTDSYIMDFKYHKIEDIVNNLVADFKPLFPEKQFSVKGKSTIRCDEEWLSEALGNIIKNACEHTENNGKVNIEISENQRSTIIEIADNGEGIGEKELPNLFTRFYKAENSSPSSTGIGLAITKAIVEKQHGIISADNKNNGLCITICLPHIDGYETI